MILLELFDEAYDYKVKLSSTVYCEYTFNANGKPGEDIEESKVVVNFRKLSMKDTNAWVIAFRRGDRLGITDAGDAFRIFATLREIIADFTRSKKPEYLCFSSMKTEASRVKLYKRMASKLHGYKDLTNKPEQITDEAASAWFNSMNEKFPGEAWMILRKT